MSSAFSSGFGQGASARDRWMKQEVQQRAMVGRAPSAYGLSATKSRAGSTPETAYTPSGSYERMKAEYQKQKDIEAKQAAAESAKQAAAEAPKPSSRGGLGMSPDYGPDVDDQYFKNMRGYEESNRAIEAGRKSNLDADRNLIANEKERLELERKLIEKEYDNALMKYEAFGDTRGINSFMNKRKGGGGLPDIEIIGTEDGGHMLTNAGTGEPLSDPMAPNDLLESFKSFDPRKRFKEIAASKQAAKLEEAAAKNFGKLSADQKIFTDILKTISKQFESGALSAEEKFSLGEQYETIVKKLNDTMETKPAPKATGLNGGGKKTPSPAEEMTPEALAYKIVRSDKPGELVKRASESMSSEDIRKALELARDVKKPSTKEKTNKETKKKTKDSSKKERLSGGIDLTEAFGHEWDETAGNVMGLGRTIGSIPSRLESFNRGLKSQH